MKMTERVTSFCVVLFLTLTSVSSIRRLNSINNLQQIPLGQAVPEQIIVLLYWFANTVENDNNAIWLNFNPENGDYGSHYYGNFEGLLENPPPGQRYYTVGNLYQDSPLKLPSYVVNHNRNDRERNRARIIIRVCRLNAGQRARIHRVYITQHYKAADFEGTRYDPNHTYEISTDLLRRIREFSVGDNQQLLASLRDWYARNITNSHIQDIRNTRRDFAGLGLLLAILLQQRYYLNQLYYTEQCRQNRQNDSESEYDWNVIGIIIITVFVILMFWLFGGSSQTNRRW